jgi:hypothetical protein
MEIDALEDCLMMHHAYSENRVTTDKTKKQKGLDIFYDKYRGRMTDEILTRSLSRARKLFGYRYE